MLESSASRRPVSRLLAAVSAMAVVGALVSVSTGSAQAAKAPTAAAPEGVSFTLEGCRNDGTITLPIGGQYICPDGVYTSGNLGKGWAELDLVPYRLTSKAGTSAPTSQDFSIAYAVDKEDAGKPGYDVLSAGVLNTALSDASCTPGTAGAESTMAPGIGGISTTLYRSFTVTQARNTTCIYDFYARLALGSHLFPGSSLHANLGLISDGKVDTGGIGAKDVSIPVREIEPQAINKDMSAVRGSDHIWNVTKQATPSSVNLGNTCEASGDYASASIDETITWTKSSAIPGAAMITTNIYATNPSARTIQVSVSDKIYAGATSTGTPLETKSFDPVNVPAKTTSLLVGTHTYTWMNPTDTTVNDVATATYTDVVTGIPIPGTTTASASATVQNTGPATNASAVIDDTETLTGAGLQFSVDSVAGATGSFAGYILGTATASPVRWTSASQSDSGSVTFRKTIYAAKGTIQPNGVLGDVARATGSDGYASADATASVDIAVDTLAILGIDKTIPAGVITKGSESATFAFDVVKADDTVASPQVNFNSGETSQSTSATGLVPGIYTVSERTATNWEPVASKQVDLSGATCTGSVAFANTPTPAKAAAVKVTVPAGFANGWSVSLYRGDDTTPLASAVTDDSGIAALGSLTEEGTYRILEDAQPGWTSDGGKGCEFAVDLPADGGKTFTCTLTNTFAPTIALAKTGDALSKVGDKVNYQLTLANTSATEATSGVPDLECRVVDSKIGFDQKATLGADDTATWGPLAFTIPSGSDPFVNQATASCTFPGSAAVVASTSANWSTNLFQPKVTVTKKADRPYAQVGDTITYTVTITNSGSADSPALVPDDTTPFTDSLVSGVTLPSSCDSLAVGESCQVTYDYVVKAADRSIPNTASVLFHPAGFPNDVTDQASASVTVIRPSFTITKTCATPDFPAGSTVVFRVDVTNTGDVPVVITLDDSTASNGGAATPLALTGANTTATATSDITNADLTFNSGRVSFTLPVGEKAQLEISLTTQNVRVTNTITGTGSLPKAYSGTTYSQVLSATDTCVDSATGATRTIGFWRTHLSFTSQVLDKEALPTGAIIGTSPLGVGTAPGGPFLNGKLCLTSDRKSFVLNSVADVMGIFWASNSVNKNGSKRTTLCAARINTGRQLLGAILNQSFSNPAPLPLYGGQNLITATLAAMSGTNTMLIRTLGTLLDQYNNSGDNQTIVIPGSLTIGKANPQAAQAIANLKAGDC